MGESTVDTFTRVHLGPPTKEIICIICGEDLYNWNKRIRLFRKETKTSHCYLLEKQLRIIYRTSWSSVWEMYQDFI